MTPPRAASDSDKNIGLRFSAVGSAVFVPCPASALRWFQRGAVFFRSRASPLKRGSQGYNQRPILCNAAAGMADDAQPLLHKSFLKVLFADADSTPALPRPPAPLARRRPEPQADQAHRRSSRRRSDGGVIATRLATIALRIAV